MTPPRFQLARFVQGPPFAIGDEVWTVNRPPREVHAFDPADPSQQAILPVHDLVDCVIFLDGKVQRQCVATGGVELLAEFTDDPPVRLFQDHELQAAIREGRRPTPAAVVKLDGTPYRPRTEALQ